AADVIEGVILRDDSPPAVRPKCDLGVSHDYSPVRGFWILESVFKSGFYSCRPGLGQIHPRNRFWMLVIASSELLAMEKPQTSQATAAYSCLANGVCVRRW